MTRALNEAGMALLRQWEAGPGGGPALRSYFCPAGKETIGYGHVLLPSDRFGEITPEQADEILRRDVDKFARWVERAVKVPLSDNEFAALTSFCFNVGVVAFSGSTLLRDVNEGRLESVPHELRRWVYAKGQEIDGLKNRREAEIKLWETP